MVYQRPCRRRPPQCRVAEAGSSLDSVVRAYAKEASTLLLAEVDKYTL